MNPKHSTPWHAAGKCRRCGSCDLYTAGPVTGGMYYKPDADLIGAAPDLLAALEDIVLKAGVAGIDDRRIDAARAAIAKARGES